MPLMMPASLSCPPYSLGEHVAFYFAGLECYVRWLIAPSLLGLAATACQVSSRRLDHPA